MFSLFKKDLRQDERLVKTESGLGIIDLEFGEGQEAAPGHMVEVHYTGWLLQDGKKGKKFDSSLDRDQSFHFDLGLGQVIAGWDQGVVGIKQGGKRLLLIPSALGYGDFGAGDDIPPGADLLFEVELLSVLPGE